MMNTGNPQLAFEFCQLPNAGVGLARLEFLINHAIGVHPKAVLAYPNLKPDVKAAVEGAARYLSEDFAPAFEMECAAIKRVREMMGFANVELMAPFVRTLKQAERVV